MSEPITPQLIKLGQRLSRNNIVRRVYLLFKILNGYDIKLQIRSIEGYLKTNLTYEQAETIAYSYERLTGISCKPTTRSSWRRPTARSCRLLRPISGISIMT